MQPLQQIDRVRRDYNKWVANQTFEDFALRFTAKSARRYSAARVGQTALGAVSFLALEAIAASITLHYGFTNTIAAIVASAVIIFAMGVPICFYAANYGVDIDLLTRGAGFGYIGSTITSLIYASFTFILFAIESAIMASALELCLGIPVSIGYLISALAVIPLVTHGMRAISRFQVWTQPIWIALNILPVVALAYKSPHTMTVWRSYVGSESGSSGFQLQYFGEAASVALAFVVQIGEQVDYLRFLPAQSPKRMAWWAALLSAGPGWIVIGVLKLLVGSFLAVYLVSSGSQSPVDPAHMYATAFRSLIDNPKVALALTCIFVVVCQLKINVTNAYAGSIAWSNFFARLTHHHPGRVVWLVFNVVLALLVMEMGVYDALEQTLALYSCVAIAWIGAVTADLVINKPLGLSPPGIEFKRAHLYDVNPVGVGAMVCAVVVAMLAESRLFGDALRALAPLLSLAVALVAAPAIAALTRGRYYLARHPEPAIDQAETVSCCICENPFEPEDMAHCPAYAGPICSLCCSIDARCQDLCKPHARLQSQIDGFLHRRLAGRLAIPSHIVDFIIILTVSLLLFGGLLSFVALTMSAPGVPHALITSVLWKAFLLIAMAAGVVSWLFALAQASGRAARNETQRQTRLLLEEIESHQRTDLALKKAKEVAEAANYAKSRYVVGLSHELRTPLNSIKGYAQLLERDDVLPFRARSRGAVIKKSADHLAGLIDGLLDIGKIEAGKLDLARDEVALHALLSQLVDMFTMQAEMKGIRFVAEIARDLPEFTTTDEKRLRQVLINLLSNAVKFTREGTVALRVSYRNEIAHIAVSDTGPGIAEADKERVFQPFERLHAAAGEPGIGLGLTISRLLTGVMGGELRLSSELGVGSEFRLRLFLPRLKLRTQLRRQARRPASDFGTGRSILVVDDDANHRAFAADLLSPYGLAIRLAASGTDALRLAETKGADLYLLDIEMPGLDGWELARRLRENGAAQAKIVMLSASAVEEHGAAIAANHHDAFLMKPVDADLLIETIADLLDGPGMNSSGTGPVARGLPESLEAVEELPPEAVLASLLQDGEIGYVRGLRDQLERLETSNERMKPFVNRMRLFVEDMDMAGFIKAVEKVREGPPAQPPSQPPTRPPTRPP